MPESLGKPQVEWMRTFSLQATVHLPLHSILDETNESGKEPAPVGETRRLLAKSLAKQTES